MAARRFGVDLLRGELGVSQGEAGVLADGVRGASCSGVKAAPQRWKSM
ncbi:MAG: hypothetical protein H6811_08145 [Phycisphaeraceae bacterium]|nr:hypothetical protein [Phycisphaeraceae bacterium]